MPWSGSPLVFFSWVSAKIARFSTGVRFLTLTLSPIDRPLSAARTAATRSCMCFLATAGMLLTVAFDRSALGTDAITGASSSWRCSFSLLGFSATGLGAAARWRSAASSAISACSFLISAVAASRFSLRVVLPSARCSSVSFSAPPPFHFLRSSNSLACSTRLGWRSASGFSSSFLIWSRMVSSSSSAIASAGFSLPVTELPLSRAVTAALALACWISASAASFTALSAAACSMRCLTAAVASSNSRLVSAFGGAPFFSLAVSSRATLSTVAS